MAKHSTDEGSTPPVGKTIKDSTLGLTMTDELCSKPEGMRGLIGFKVFEFRKRLYIFGANSLRILLTYNHPLI